MVLIATIQSSSIGDITAYYPKRKILMNGLKSIDVSAYKNIKILWDKHISETVSGKRTYRVIGEPISNII